MDYPAQRRQRLVELLAQDGGDTLLVTKPVNVTYLTGFTGDSSALVLTGERAVLVSDARFSGQIAEECPGLEAHIRPPARTLHQALADVLGGLGSRAVEFDSAHVTVADWETLRGLAPNLDWKPGRDRVEGLRVVKDSSEVAEIREAIDIAERAIAMFRTTVRPTDREKDLGDSLELYLRRAGGRASSFPSIVAAGERAALPHAPPTSRAVGEAELLLVDWGASGRLYQSDLTRVFAVHKISPQLEQVYAVVLEAARRAVGAVRPGVQARDVDAEARTAIAAAGFGDFFGHGLGHGLGLEVHEAPAIRQNSEAVLQPGMVFTVEPGVYLPGWGGVRLEDDVLVTPDGCEVLTHVAKEPIPILDFRF
jgi:Xaa-Pro aminopeptidase